MTEFGNLLLRLLLPLLLLVTSAAPAPSQTNLDVRLDEGLLIDDSWHYVGELTGGVTFAVPKDCESSELRPEEKAAGILLLYWGEDFTLQLRVFEPAALTYEQFKQRISGEPTAEVRVRMSGGTEILSYRNTRPNANSELYGIVLTGLDGRLYKISLFTGSSESFAPDAPVWKIAEIVEQTAGIRDFSEWGLTADPEE